MSREGNFVRVRRGILEHIQNGNLTLNEYTALFQLILYADAATAGYNVNAPLLMYRCGYGFNLDTAQTVLNALHNKGYIWYRAARRTKRPQPYWINRYCISRGAYKDRFTDLSAFYDRETLTQAEVWGSCRTDHGSQTLEESTTYVTTQPQSAVQPTVRPTVQPTDEYKTETYTRNYKTKPSLTSECVTSATNASQTAHEARQSATSAGVSHSRVHHECIHPASIDSIVHPSCIHPESVQRTQPWTWGDAIKGYKFRFGDDPHYVDLTTGERMDRATAQKVVAQLEKGQ